MFNSSYLIITQFEVVLFETFIIIFPYMHE